MPPAPSRRLLAIADDLSGAAETAAGLLSRTTRSRVLLVHPVTLRQELADVPRSPGEATVLDLDSRYLPPAPAADRVRAALAGVDPGTPVLAKIDSLLRGNTAATAAALAEGGAPVLAAPALPAAGRTVRSGVVHLGDTPLHLTDAWRVETAAPPRSLADAFAPLPVELIDLGTVRAPRARLAAALATATAAGRLAACDAETDQDLDAIAGAALALPRAPRLIGAGGLAAALGRQLASGQGPGTGRVAAGEGPAVQAGGPPSLPPPRGDRPVLVVVGSAEPVTAAQISQLTADGAVHHALPSAALAAAVAPSPLGALPLAEDVTVLSVAPTGTGERREDPRAVVRGLAALAAATVAAAPRPVDLVLTGGETARRVLEALAIHELEPRGQIHHGAVLSRTRDERSVVTRPGSFGGPDSLRRIVRALRPGPPTAPIAPTKRKVLP
ncbi:four-carbon acid sugar kinase family protein [Streptomyces millisiae]|uniref:Four-carbon acid sugar kinase family protein n=1 Tax=Streptomyces millisiae TaxID=3075542 RepID=A0ABU2LXL5_9ACTN|nr:four-carbon acid sugar kinase family protein [Streptomyces sp. DSM 44918]MDT0322343.1 four-carbon acid sugar kinase family protein [Streptomyces sp. DSM 44918]